MNKSSRIYFDTFQWPLGAYLCSGLHVHNQPSQCWQAGWSWEGEQPQASSTVQWNQPKCSPSLDQQATAANLCPPHCSYSSVAAEWLLIWHYVATSHHLIDRSPWVATLLVSARGVIWHHRWHHDKKRKLLKGKNWIFQELFPGRKEEGKPCVKWQNKLASLFKKKSTCWVFFCPNNPLRLGRPKTLSNRSPNNE